MASKQTDETAADNEEDESVDAENAEGTTVFVKNLNFGTNEDTLKEVTWISFSLLSYIFYFVLYSSVYSSPPIINNDILSFHPLSPTFTEGFFFVLKAQLLFVIVLYGKVLKSCGSKFGTYR